jgi:hypothetical protein
MLDEKEEKDGVEEIRVGPIIRWRVDHFARCFWRREADDCRCCVCVPVGEGNCGIADGAGGSRRRASGGGQWGGGVLSPEPIRHAKALAGESGSRLLT